MEELVEEVVEVVVEVVVEEEEVEVDFPNLLHLNEKMFLSRNPPKLSPSLNTFYVFKTVFFISTNLQTDSQSC